MGDAKKRDSLPVTYSPAEVAEFCNVTRRTVYEWLDSGKLHAQKAGPRRWLITRGDIDAFLHASDRAVSAPAPMPVSAPVVESPKQPSLPAEMLPKGSGALAPMPTAATANRSPKPSAPSSKKVRRR